MELNELSKVKTTTDEEVISQILAGDVNAYRQIIKKYNSYLYKVGRSYGFNHPDTEDLMQESFVNAYKNLSKFKHRSSFKTWIVRIMYNACYHKLQKSSYKNERPINFIISEDARPLYKTTDTNPEKATQNKELKSILENAIQQIPEKYRIVFTFRELNGMNVKDTADALDISESNVKVRLSRAKTMLQEKISGSYTYEDLFEFNLIYCDKMVERVLNQIMVS